MPKAGDDEGIGFAGTAEGFSGLLAVAIVSIVKVECGVLKAVGHVVMHSTARRACQTRWSKLATAKVSHQSDTTATPHKLTTFTVVRL